MKNGSAPQPAPGKNKTMKLNDVYKASTGQEMTNHHDALADAAACASIALDNEVFRRRYRALKNNNGLHRLSDRDDDIILMYTKAKAEVYPPLPEFWADGDPADGEPAAKRPNLGPHSGPTTRASGTKSRLAEYFDLHLEQEYLEKVATWTNNYAAGQVVKKVAGRRGQRATFVPCSKTDPAARYRFQARKAGETLADSKAKYKPVSRVHVQLVLAMIMRAGALGHCSLYQAWVMADEGSLMDPCIRESCTRDNFETIWRILTFVDYDSLDYNENGFVVTSDHILRVRSFLLAAEQAWEKNWTFGQEICLDEYGSKGAQSRFCPIAMFNKDKPIKHHIDIIMSCCPLYDYPARLHVFQKTGTRLADLVMDYCWNPDWNGKNKVLYTDSRYCTMDLIKRLHEAGAGFVSTMSPEAASKGRKKADAKVEQERAEREAREAAMTPTQRTQAAAQRLQATKKVMPFPPISKSVQASLQPGWMRQARLEVPAQGGNQNPLVIEAYLWMDSKLVGFVVANDFLGTPDGTTRRFKGGRWVEIPSFAAQRFHALYYGGVDRIGKGAKVYGIDFAVVPWHRHLVTTTLNLHAHAMWTLVQYKINLAKETGGVVDPLLQPFASTDADNGSTSSSRGLTKRRLFLLMMTRDVIKRCGEEIAAGEAVWDPRPLRLRRPSAPAAPAATPPSSTRRGRPPKHGRVKRCNKYATVAACLPHVTDPHQPLPASPPAKTYHGFPSPRLGRGVVLCAPKGPPTRTQSARKRVSILPTS